MYCILHGKQCQHTGCTQLYKLCETNKRPQPSIVYSVIPANKSFEERISELEAEVQRLKAENENLRRMMLGTSLMPGIY